MYSRDSYIAGSRCLAASKLICRRVVSAFRISTVAVQASTTYKLVINLKTSKALGLSEPASTRR
jgi:hypothetical protein